MAKFFGKTITTDQANRIRAAHAPSVAAEDVGKPPKLIEIEQHYLAKAASELPPQEKTGLD